MYNRLIEDRSSSTQRRSNDEPKSARAKPGEAMMALAAWWRGAGCSAPEFDTAVGYLAALTERPILIEAPDAGGVQRFPASWTEDQAGWKSPLRIPASEMRALSDPRADRLEQLMDMVHKGLSTRQEAIPQEWPENAQSLEGMSRRIEALAATRRSRDELWQPFRKGNKRRAPSELSRHLHLVDEGLRRLAEAAAPSPSSQWGEPSPDRSHDADVSLPDQPGVMGEQDLLAQVVGEVLGEGAQSLTESDVPNLQAHEQAEARYEAQFENWVASKGWVIQPAPGERNRCSQYALNMAARAAHRRPIDDEALRDEVDAQRMEFELDWAGDELPADGMLALDADHGGHGPALVRALNRQFGVGVGEGFVVEMYRPITAVSMGPDDGFVPVYLDAEGSVDAAAVEGIDPQRLIRVVQRGQHYDAILPHESLSVSLEGNEPAKGLRPGKRKRGKPIVADVADSNELICRFCSKKYKTPYGLHQHEWNHHGAPLPEKSALTRTSEKKHVCDFCQKQFSTGGDLKKHRRTHTGEKPYDCEFCPKRFADKSNLNKHIRIHTDEKPYGCDFCAEQFAAIDHLKRHMPTHTGIKSHICDFCQKQFVSGGDLKQHMRTHTGEKPFVCGVCQMGFSTSGNLTVHRRKHTGEKPFGCDFCSRRFANSSSRARHVRIHTDERPFVCEMCRKGFFTTGKLKVHMRTHANGKTPRE